MRRDPLAWVNDRPGWARHDRNHTIHDAILYGLITALTTAVFVIAFSPRRKK